MLLLHYFLNMSRAWLILMLEVLFIANVKALLHQKVYDTQAEGSKSRLYSRTQKKKIQHSSATKEKNNEAHLLVYLK